MSAGYDRSVDPALDTLLLPFYSAVLDWPKTSDSKVLFLRARAGHQWLDEHRASIVCEQSFKPLADELSRAGFAAAPSISADTKYDLILVLPPRQREESRALLARAVSALNPGGTLVCAAANNEGARSSEGDLQQLMIEVQSLSKSKCRVFWSTRTSGNVSPLVNEWSTLDAPRPICDGRFMSRPGIFAWDRIDPASALLASHLSKDLRGNAADLGCGFGFLSSELLQRCPTIRSIDLYEAEARALDLAKINLQSLNCAIPVTYHWHDVTHGIDRNRYDVIVMNPPFHTQSRIDRPDVGQRFIAVAAEALKPGGQLWLVANRHLPYESLLADTFATIRPVAQENGFKVIHAIKRQAPSTR